MTVNIQWFPGHMTKAIRMMEENLRLVDALIYVIDARAVYSCDNPLFNKLLQGKKVLYVFNKCDLVDKDDLALWCEETFRQGDRHVGRLLANRCGAQTSCIRQNRKIRRKRRKNIRKSNGCGRAQQW